MKHILICSALVLLGIFFRSASLLTVPPSLYWEEIALGYDSYSILQTGKDHHGDSFPLVAFESFGDWKPSLYFYYLVPFIALFGVSDLAIRVAAVIVGIVFLIGVPFLAKQLKVNPYIALLVTVISPWAIHFSRAAWESYLAATLILWGVIFGLQASRSKLRNTLILSSLLFGLSMYAYHAARIIAPLLFLTILFLSVPIRFTNTSLKKLQQYVSQHYKQYVGAVVLFVIIILPLVIAVLQQDASITHRFQETNIFSDISVIERSNSLKEMSGNSLLSRIFYHRYVLFGEVIIKNIFSYFTLDYLIVSGDSNPRHTTGFTGILYPIEVLFLIVGVITVIRRSIRISFLLFIWLGLALLPASVSIPNPHALRTLIALPIFLIWIAEGLQVTYAFAFRQLSIIHQLWFFKQLPLSLFKKVISYTLIVVLISIYTFSITGFWQYYTHVYPKQSQQDWQYGYSQLISVISPIQPDVPVFISREFGRPAMYYWFYSKTNPRLVQEENSIANKDQSEFLTYKNITFYRSLSEVQAVVGAVIAVPAIQKTEMAIKLAEQGLSYTEESTITDLNGESVWSVLKVQDE